MQSSSVRCNVNDFYSTLMELCNENVEMNQKALETNVKKAGDHAVAELRAVPWRHSRGRYNAGWKSEYVVMPWGTARATVHNTTQPSLTHLLENGHEMFIGGHDTGRRVKAYKHIEPAYENAKPILEGGGVE